MRPRKYIHKIWFGIAHKNRISQVKNFFTARLSDGESGEVNLPLPPPADEVVDWDEVRLRWIPLFSGSLPLIAQVDLIGLLTTTALVPTLQARWHHI